MIGKKISIIASDKKEFDKTRDDYNKTFKKNGFTQKIIYQNQTSNRRKTKII